MNIMKYKIEFQNKMKIKDESLTTFISEKIKYFGGTYLEKNIKVNCYDNIIEIGADEKLACDIHCALFFVGKYLQFKCQIYRIK